MATNCFKQVVFDIPHGGQKLPDADYTGYEEIRLNKASRILNPFETHLNRAITKVDLWSDADLYSWGIYHEMEGIPSENKIFFEILRVIIDVNRELNDYGPNCRDSIIKTHTNQGKQLYHYADGHLPDDIIKKLEKKLRQTLLRSTFSSC